MKRKSVDKLFKYVFLFRGLNLLFMWCSFIFMGNFLLWWLFSESFQPSIILQILWATFERHLPCGTGEENYYSKLQLKLLIKDWRKTQLAARSIQFTEFFFVVISLLFFFYFQLKQFFERGHALCVVLRQYTLAEIKQGTYFAKITMENQDRV